MEYILFPVTLMLLFRLSAPLQSSAPPDHHSLLAFKSAITSDPNNSFANWNTSIPICNWTGVSCAPYSQKVVMLNLTNMDLEGALSPALGNLTTLVDLILPYNKLHGTIPDELGKITGLVNLILTGNNFTGTIPPSITNLSTLDQLDLSNNFLDGPIPPGIGMLTQLSLIYLYGNQLSGSIPSSIGNLSQLFVLQLLNNTLTGPIPHELGNLGQLQDLELYNNRLSGAIPPELGNLTRLEYLRLFNNLLSASIPPELGMLNNMKELNIWGNELSGNIPNSLGNCSKISVLDLRNNQLSGTVPIELGNLDQLIKIILEHNYLISSSNIPLAFVSALTNCSHLEYIKMSYNRFSGILAPSIGNLSSKLSILDFGNNRIRGSIPEQITTLTNLTYLNLGHNLLSGYLPSGLKRLHKLERLDFSGNNIGGSLQENIGNMKSLGELDVSWNNLSGRVPGSLSKLPELRRLFLHHNRLSGEIPETWKRCPNLELVDISHNHLSGNIPREVMASFGNLQFYLNLSWNFLQGSLPAEISKIVNAQAMDISCNKLHGIIPAALGNCLALEHLNLSHNAFEGPIPDQLGNLKNLESVDLSFNFLSGSIPTSLTKMKALRFFNASFNNLTGQVPAGGLFSDNTRNASFMGNTGLCGPAKYLVQACPNESKRAKSLLKKLLLSAAGMIIFLLFTSIFGILWCGKCALPQFDLPDFMFGRLRYPKFTYQDLASATNGFNDTNLIGVGSFGSVFKGILRDGVVVAIKVLCLQNKELPSSFERECEVLARTRHRNLVRVISACSYLDFKALILQFATNGSLEKHLYPDSHEQSVCELKINDCLNIAIDVANGMEYLHHDCPTQVVHCDLKPSNVLLDSDMTALVADFGISRLTGPTNSIDSLSTTTTMKGSIGYIAPEYGLGMNISTKGDVYSYGILLLEMVTRKRPTDAHFTDDINLPKWVRAAFPERVTDIVDKEFLQNLEMERINECLVSYIHIGLLCTSESPRERPTMRYVRNALEAVRSKLVGGATLTSNLRRTTSDLILDGSNKIKGGAYGSESSTY